MPRYNNVRQPKARITKVYVNSNQKRKVRKPKQQILKTSVFTTTQQPRLGALTPGYRRYLNQRKARVNNMKRNPNNNKMARRTINPYIQCRLNPFGNANGMGIPDGTDAKRLLVDHRQITSFVVGTSGAFNIVIAPVMPQIIWFQPLGNDTTYTVNGGHPTHHNGATDGFHHVTCSQYQNITFTRNDAVGWFNTIPTYLGAARARIVTIGFRLIYTGSTMNNSGSIMVNRMGFSVQAPSANIGDFVVQSDHGESDETINYGQVFLRPCNTSSNTFDIMNQESVRAPLRQGIQGLLKHASGDYQWLSVSDNETYLAKTNDDKYSMLYQGADLGSDTLARWPVVTFVDDQWSPAAIAIRGATEGQSFDIETVYCVEYIPNLDSASSSLAKQPPKQSDKSLELANKAAKNAPLAGASSIFESAAKIAMIGAPLLI